MFEIKESHHIEFLNFRLDEFHLVFDYPTFKNEIRLSTLFTSS